MATQVAAARQPFAPLNSSRLQNLTSLKNRQNALPNSFTSSKRKAEPYDFDTNDSENIDPVIYLSPKRSKASNGSAKPNDLSSFTKPTNFFLTAPSSNDFSSLNSAAASPRRPILQAKSPAPRLNTSASKASSLSAPAGRSPTRKRVGILNRKKTASPYTRIDPPKFSTPSSKLGFSIDAALSGTIPSYGARQRQSFAPLPKEIEKVVGLNEPSLKEEWFFEIHEDTPEDEATNLMEHGACTLDISSDEECEARMRDERGKENIPPMDDISQTQARFSAVPGDSEIADIKARIRASRKKHENAIEIDRSPLGDLAAEEFYAEGCDGESVFLIPSDSPEELPQGQEHVESQVEFAATTFDFSADFKGKGREVDIETLMRKDAFDVAPKATLLEPIEKAEDGFEVWESGSAKGDE